MEISFVKYQGAGNDFILIDSRGKTLFAEDNQALIARLCDRHFGIGADGLILLKDHATYDFEMVYFNADGALGSLCGNGGRCVVAFAKALKIIENTCSFLASDGLHHAVCTRSDWVELSMGDVTEIETFDSYLFLNTGSPHVVQFVQDIAAIDVDQEGKRIRFDSRFAPGGTNVNFIMPFPNEINVESLKIATFERGVEAETLACGTGITAAAIAYHQKQGPKTGSFVQDVLARGGELKVRFTYAEPEKYHQIWLCGPAQKVFEGFTTVTTQS